MDKSEALEKFCQKNHLNMNAASNEMDGNYDPRIAGLPAQVDAWLSKIDPEDHDIFLKLLSRYHYLTEACCRQRYCRVLDMLEEQLQGVCGLDEVLFVTIESSGGFKTGSDNVRADLYSRSFPKITKGQILAAQSKLKKQKMKQYRAVVFLDDVVGSGMTLWSSMESFCHRFRSTVFAGNGPLLFYACIAPRRRGMKHIRKNCEDYGISAVELTDKAWYEEPAFDRGSADYLRLQKYEEMVAGYLKDPGSQKSFFMGFNKNRLLVSFYYNTPNNTLCTFWRATPDNVPPFRRDGDQPSAQPAAPRPTIDALRACVRKIQSGAYALGMDRREKKKHG